MGKNIAKKKPSSDDKKLNLLTKPEDFFKQELGKAFERQRLKADPHTEYYLVDLLVRFMVSDNLFAVDEKGGKHEEVLALLLKEAMSAADEATKQRGLKRLGDISLYTAGFFGDRLSRKVVDVDYYIGMGSSAYGSLAHMRFSAAFQRVFIELSAQFHKFVDILAEVSESSSSKDNKNILRLYEVWLKTRSERAEKTLKEAGIIPNRLIKPDPQ